MRKPSAYRPFHRRDHEPWAVAPCAYPTRHYIPIHLFDIAPDPLNPKPCPPLACPLAPSGPAITAPQGRGRAARDAGGGGCDEVRSPSCSPSPSVPAPSMFFHHLAQPHQYLSSGPGEGGTVSSRRYPFACSVRTRAPSTGTGNIPDPRVDAPPDPSSPALFSRPLLPPSPDPPTMPTPRPSSRFHCLLESSLLVPALRHGFPPFNDCPRKDI